MEEEFILFKNLNKEDEESEESNIIINGDINIEIHNYGKDNDAKKNTRKVRNATVKSAWKNKIKNRDMNECQCCGKKFRVFS